MGKSSSRGVAGRADVIEVFSPRRSGPWHLLHPLHTKYGFLALAALTLVGFIYCRVHNESGLGFVVIAVAVVLLALSFRIAWQLTGLVIRSRAELVVVGAIGAVALWLRTFLSPVWSDASLIAVAAVVFALPWSRRYVVARACCVMDRHRLRLCLRQTKVRTMNMDGSLPLMLWARPTKTGERVWLWIRAGSAGDDIESALDYIAPACYAREARIHRVRKITTLVAVEVIRRDPLAKPEPITSALKKYIGKFTGTRTEEGTEPIQAATVADITGIPVQRTDSGAAKGKKPATKPASDPAAATTTAGEDLSDYID